MRAFRRRSKRYWVGAQSAALRVDRDRLHPEQTGKRGLSPIIRNVLQRVGEHPASRVHELTPRLWKQLFAANPLRSALHNLRA
jgi:hypothetical protein